MHFRHLVLLAFVFALGACDKSNPYPGDSKTTPEKPDQEQRAIKTYTLDAPFSVTCTVGIRCDFRVAFQVTNDSPVLTFENLPDGASVDANSGSVSWVPSQPEYDGQTIVVLANLRGAHDLEIQRQVAIALVSRTH